MATRSENRKINIYINTKLANKNLKDLKAESRKLNREIDLLTPGTEAFNKKMLELKAHKKILSDHRKELNNVQSGWQKLKKTLGPVAGIMGGIFAVGKVISYGKELANTAFQIAGVNLAFLRLGETGRTAFNEIKDATRGTMSNLDIKKAINEFVAFKLPLDDAGALFEFLNLQSTKLGKNIKDLAPSLVEGLSKESKLRIDNLGISASVLNKELEKTPNFAKAVANIAKRELASAGDILDRTVNKQAQWNALIENAETTLATGLKPAFDALYGAGSSLINFLGFGPKSFNEVSESIYGNALASRELAGESENLLDEYELLISDGLEPTVEKKERLEEITVLLTDKLGKSVTAIDKETGALIINTDAAREKIKLMRFSSDEEAATLASRLKGVKDAIKAGDKENESINKTYEIRKRILDKEVEDYEKRNKGSLGGVTFATRNSKSARKALDELTITQTKRSRNTEKQNKLLASQLDLTKKLEELNFTEADAEAIFKVQEKKEILNKEEINAAKKLEEYQAKAKDREKEREKTLTSLNGQLEKLKKTTASLQEQQNIKTSEDPELAKIKLSYAEKIKLAQDLELKKGEIGAQAHAEKLALMQMRDDEIEAYEEKRDILENEKDLELDAKKAELEQKLLEETFTAEELALSNLEIHYQALVDEANKYGIDTTSLVQKYGEEDARIKKEFDDKEVKSEKEKNDKLREERVNEFKEQAEKFNALGDLTTSFYGLLKDEGEKYTMAQKALKLTQIAYDTAAAISSLVAHSQANPLNATTFGGAGIAQYIAGFSQIVNNMAQAKKLLTTDQKAEGGYSEGTKYKTVGKDDGRTYNAKYTGDTKAGMLYEPSLVLAAENGPEYYVPNALLSNPQVASYVSNIESIRAGTQMADGGFDKKSGEITNNSNTSTTVINPDNERLTSAVNALVSILQNGIDAKISDGTVNDIFNVKEELDSISGG